MVEQLGNESMRKEKGLVLLFSLACLAFLYWASIGSSPEELYMYWFYIAGGFIFWTFPLAYDIFIKRDDWPIDTVSVEKSPLSFLTYRNQFYIGLALSAFIGIQAFTTGTVWVLAPTFSTFNSLLGNAV